ncbi:MAG: hypothetical protein JSU63_19195 [Phycisphaerales bacterium]|nr:MAG: hypothetical protein JSU63_19195 [Phycisphaerales bacterium]
MTKKPALNSVIRTVAGVCAAGVVIGSGCSMDLGALMAGLDAAANYSSEQDDDISFGDWLRDELDDL